jgi:peroxiredoxin family protein
MLRAWNERHPERWSDTFRMAKEIGDVSVFACSLSMDTFGFSAQDLDPLVDGVEGVAGVLGRGDRPRGLHLRRKEWMRRR